MALNENSELTLDWYNRNNLFLMQPMVDNVKLIDNMDITVKYCPIHQNAMIKLGS